MKIIIGLIALACLGIGVAWVAWPEKTGEVKDRVEAAGAVAVDNTLSALEKRVGLAQVAARHLDKEKAARRENLIRLKADRLRLEQQVTGLRAEVAGGTAPTKAAQLAALQQSLEDTKACEQRAQAAYKAFLAEVEKKKQDLKLAELKLSLLKTELNNNASDSGPHGERARVLADELQQACSRLEAEIAVQHLEQN